MKLNENIKEQISEKLERDFNTKKITYGSQNAYARSIGVNISTVSTILSRKWIHNPALISDKKWQEIATIIGYTFTNNTEQSQKEWQVAPTETYLHINAMLHFCKEESETAIFCDEAGIGKTFTCEAFQKQNTHTYIIKGSNATNKTKFIKELASAVGIEVRGKYDEILEKTMRSLLSHAKNKPLLIFDEAGDLDDKTFLLIKQLYNRLKGVCGMFMTGAGGLKKKLDAGIRLDKNGFDEVADRFGFKETRLNIVPDDKTERELFYNDACTKVCIANGITNMDTIKEIQLRGGSLRRVEKEIKKRKKH